MLRRIDASIISDDNEKLKGHLDADYAALADKLARQDIDIEKITELTGEFQVAVPSWGTGTGGTRFASFPGEGEPRNIWESWKTAQ